nr:hypothetical protein [Streptomyces sp. wa1063]
MGEYDQSGLSQALVRQPLLYDGERLSRCVVRGGDDVRVACGWGAREEYGVEPGAGLDCLGDGFDVCVVVGVCVGGLLRGAPVAEDTPGG